MSETPEQQSDYSEAREAGNAQGEEFSSPSITSLASLVDGRSHGDFESRYPRSAWVQIFAELFYLLAILGGSIFVLIWMARAVVLEVNTEAYFFLFGAKPTNTPLVVWAATGLSGAVGGATFALKWLYHSVAKQTWHRDRAIWRIVVPPILT